MVASHLFLEGLQEDSCRWQLLGKDLFGNFHTVLFSDVQEHLPYEDKACKSRLIGQEQSESRKSIEMQIKEFCFFDIIS